LERRLQQKFPTGEIIMAQANQGGKEVERTGRRGGELSRRGESSSGFWTDPAEYLRLGPFGMMRRMQEDMDRMLAGSGYGSRERGWSPAIEVSERDNNLVVCAELPGLEKEDVKVEVTDDSIVIHGERRHEHEEERKGYYRSERSYGEFYRTVPLPEHAKADEAKATFRNGVLEISVPMAQEQKSRRRSISIETRGAERKNVTSESTGAEEKRKTG
jgi:HSP20 family protein